LQQKANDMNCDEAEVLLHALVDREVDAGRAQRIITHVGGCASCAAQLRRCEAVRAVMSNAALRFSAPPGLRARIKATVPAAAVRAAPYWTTLFKSFALGSALSAAAAALLMIAVIRSDQDQVIVSDVVSAHLRSLQANHLTDVQPGDERGVKPWFRGRLGAAPPAPDLTAQGFNLVGGRIDYVLGNAVAAIVYRRNDHVINLFVAQGADAERGARLATMQGYNVELWSERGLNLCAVGDVSAEELQDFRKKFEAAAWTDRV
jgi:anti-sigma factor RsiW